MNSYRTLHLASFQGNIGDNANHTGTKNLFYRNDFPALEFNNLEIRRFFRKELFFDDNFLDKVNQHDLLIIGGGNYFELWPENTKSGTTIDLSPSDLDKIKVPIVFYSLGVDLGQGCSSENKNKFESFISYCENNPKIFMSVRNDGAFKNLQNLYGNKFNDYIKVIPDGGFFSNYVSKDLFEENLSCKRLGINLAGDMLEHRTEKIGVDCYLEQFSKFICLFVDKYPDYKITFFTHIFRDIQLISTLFEILPDKIRRETIEIAPYGQGDDAARTIFGQYNKCDIIIGNRFHANVVPIGNSIPTIGISNYIQIPNLYSDLGLKERVINCDHANFSENLLLMVTDTFDNYNDVKSKYKSVSDTLNKSADFEIQNLKNWLINRV